MATGTLVSVEEYLSTSYRPDREYIDGVIVERNLGEDDHSSLQTSVGWLSSPFVKNNGKSACVPSSECKSRSNPISCAGHVRRPRIRGRVEPIITKPPFICIEILSKKDTVESMQDRIDDYLAFGVPTSG